MNVRNIKVRIEGIKPMAVCTKEWGNEQVKQYDS